MRLRYKIPIVTFIVLVLVGTIIIFYPKDMPRGVYGMVIESDSVIISKVSDYLGAVPP